MDLTLKFALANIVVTSLYLAINIFIYLNWLGGY